MKDPAEILYPTQATPAPAPGAAAPAPDVIAPLPVATAGDATVAQSAEEPAADASLDPATLYDPVGHYGRAFDGGLDRLADHFEVTKEQREEQRRNASSIFSELEFEPGTAAQFHSLFVHHVINQPDDATLDQWEVETHRRMRERFGDQAERKLADTREYLASNPKLVDMLNLSGLGSNPDVVEDLVLRVQRLRNTGRLKTPKSKRQ